MSPVLANQIDFIQTLRLSWSVTLFSPADFIIHVYYAVFKRQPDFDPTRGDEFNAVGFDPWGRCEYLFQKLLSGESLHSANSDYEAFLESFLSSLGYFESRRLMVAQLMEIYPSIEYFLREAEQLRTSIATRTQTMLAYVESDPQPGANLKALTVDIPAEIKAINLRLDTLQKMLGDIQTALASNASSADCTAPSTSHGSDENTGLLLAILAQIRLGTVK